MRGAATLITAGVRAAFTVDALLTQLAADAVTIFHRKDATNTLALVDAPVVFAATNLAASQLRRATLLIVDTDFALLATDAFARNVSRLAANAVFAHLACLATDALAHNVIR